MTTRRTRLARTLAALGAAGALMLSVSGCGTDSPKEQIDREHKAASVPVFKLHMAHDLWSRTNRDSSRNVDKPKSLADDPVTGMATIELTGPQMVDYLQILDFNAHSDIGARDKSLAVSVYDAVAPVVDRIQTPPAPNAPAPEITVSAAVTSAAATTTAPK
ncbi:hypothetical protein AB0L82_43315 [Nocardia sp. NPDC052001]|uniref:hypothetical protein n=1 Tax=Nocardia sp. NPDC052001 TaxID=3154853 RepID=UPI003446DA4E